MTKRSQSLVGLQGAREDDEATKEKSSTRKKSPKRDNNKKDKRSKSLVGLRMMELIDNTMDGDKGSRRGALVKTDSVKKLEGMGLVKSLARKNNNGSKKSVCDEAPSYNWSESAAAKESKRSKSLVDLRTMELADDSEKQQDGNNNRNGAPARGLVKKKSARKLEGTGIVKSRKSLLQETGSTSSSNRKEATSSSGRRSKSPKRSSNDNNNKPKSRVKALTENYDSDRSNRSTSSRSRRVSANLQGLMEKFDDSNHRSNDSRRYKSGCSRSKVSRTGSNSSLKMIDRIPRSGSSNSLGSLYGSCHSRRHGGDDDSSDSGNDDSTFHSAVGDEDDHDLDVSSLGDFSAVNNNNDNHKEKAAADNNFDDDQSVADSVATTEDGEGGGKTYRSLMRSSILAVVGAQRIISCQESIDALEGTEQSFAACQQKVADAKREDAARCIQRFFKYCQAVHENHKEEILYWQEEKKDVLRRQQEELETVQNLLQMGKEHALQELLAELEAAGKAPKSTAPAVKKLDWDHFCIEMQQLKDDVKEQREANKQIKESMRQLSQANKLLKTSEDTQISKLEGFTTRIVSLKKENNELESLVELGERAMEKAVPEVAKAGKVLEEIKAKKKVVAKCLEKVVKMIRKHGDSDLFEEVQQRQLRLEVALGQEGGARRLIKSYKKKSKAKEERKTLRVLERVVSHRSLMEEQSEKSTTRRKPLKRHDSAPLLSLIQMSQEHTQAESSKKGVKRTKSLKENREGKRKELLRQDSAPLLGLIEMAHEQSTAAEGSSEQRRIERYDSARSLAEMRRRSGSSNSISSLKRVNSTSSARSSSGGMREVLKRSAPSLVIDISDGPDGGDSTGKQQSSSRRTGLRRNGSAPSLALDLGGDVKRERRLKKMSAGLKRVGSNASISRAGDDEDDSSAGSREQRRSNRRSSRNSSKSPPPPGPGLVRNTSAPPSLGKYRESLDSKAEAEGT